MRADPRLSGRLPAVDNAAKGVATSHITLVLRPVWPGSQGAQIVTLFYNSVTKRPGELRRFSKRTYDAVVTHVGHLSAKPVGRPPPTNHVGLRLARPPRFPRGTPPPGRGIVDYPRRGHDGRCTCLSPL